MLNLKITIRDLLFYFLTIAVFFVAYMFQVKNYKDSVVYGTFFIIGFLSLSALCLMDNFISIIKVYYSFVFIFFYCAPIQQYSSGRMFWNLTGITDKDYLIANIYIIISMLLVFVMYSFSKRVKETKTFYKSEVIEISSKVAWTYLLLDCLCLWYFIMTKGIFTFASTSMDTIFSSVQKIIRFFPVATLLIFNNAENKKRMKYFYFAINIIVLILFMPLAGAVSRFLLFATYLMIFVQKLSKVQSKFILPLALLVGFIIVFPIFNFFKTNTIANLMDISMVSDPFNTVDFDAYQMFIYSMKYVEEKGLLYGGNIITAMLFFIPRSIWNGKLHHSGELVSSYFHGHYTNLSCPYIGELYLAFGVIGIIIGSTVLGVLLKKFDSLFLNPQTSKTIYITIFFGMFIYLLRGALLPTVAYTMALIISQFVALEIVKKNI